MEFSGLLIWFFLTRACSSGYSSHTYYSYVRVLVRSPMPCHRLAGFLVASRPKEENPLLWLINSWKQLISQADKSYQLGYNYHL
jgi:hypothetical protein